MTAETKVEEQPHMEEAVKTPKEEPKAVEKCSSYKEESNFLSDLKESERKSLTELKSKLEDAILSQSLFKNEEEEPKKSEKSTAESENKEEKENKDETLNENDEKPEGGKEDEVKKQENDEKVVEETNINLWGVPLLPSKSAEGIDVILLKFLRAREFKVNEAFEMLRKTLLWRKEKNLDSILDEDLAADLSRAAYMDGVDREGHPVCYNVYGVFDNEELYKKTFGTEEKREEFLRWRLQLMEKGIQKLELKPGGVSSLLQINDLRNSPGPSKKELRIAMKQAVDLLQDNYPEFVAKNIFINAPFWYYALNALLSPFLTQRTKSKFVVARPAKVTETLLKYIPVEELPVRYGGLKREDDNEFSKEDGVVSEITIKASSTATIEIPVDDVGAAVTWDVSVLGWEVNYKEEFIPADEGSYTVIVQKSKKMGFQDTPIRNSFRNNEPGKIVITIDNGSSKRKRVFYRYKTKKTTTTTCF